MPTGLVEALDHEAKGITRQEGKTIFVEGGLPGETVEYVTYRKKPHYEQAHLAKVIKPSPYRVKPLCPHFGVCGGCLMQHLETSAQLAIKQRVLEDSLWHIGRVKPDRLMPPIQGPDWGYRHKARLGVRRVLKKGGVLVGFHERKSSYIADISSCAVLHPLVSALLLPLRELIEGLSIRERLPQIEVAVGEKCLALVLRILEPLSLEDEKRLSDFAKHHQVSFYLQAQGPETACRFDPLDNVPLDYSLPEFGVRLEFTPTEFTQVNHAVNQVLMRRVLGFLDPRPDERIVDLFCGLGNFTLPIARSGAHVVGIEGSAVLVGQGQKNAQNNQLTKRVRFMVANLFECGPGFLAALGAIDKLLIDPPREGALEVVKSLPDADTQGDEQGEGKKGVQNAKPQNGWESPRRIVYVSCNPATLARDAAILTGQKGYRLALAGIANMFPHTAHVESIAVFEKIPSVKEP